MRNELEEFKSFLGSPAYEDQDVLIYQGDCLKLMNQLPEGYFSLTVTSPPYNIGKEYESVLSVEDYIAWMVEWIAQVYRCTSRDGAFWLNLGYLSLPHQAKAIPIPYLIWDKVPFYLIQEIVWNYSAGVAGKLFFSPRNEKFLWYVKDANHYIFNLDDVRDPNVKYPHQKKNGKLKCNTKGKNPTDVWQIPKVTSGKNRSSKERTSHPAQFPIQLVSRIILASSNLGDIVFDPFLGSGSTAEAAIRNGRKIIGFEINDLYIDMAIKRIKTFLDEQSNRVEQKSLFELLTDYS
ncbi:site-specific DNA-methyltransferase [Lyngbya sp. PCC 8106]|uniref:DNA-methyltransferase n=1 Tax=Lyngbya sp. (strain PCC 8106) TaxID=313612 RepID=UPI0000EA99A2|nr:site-specific DNA-methyltransferase [Lyngbya sp. PCC 8106]EAW36848.1 DNA-methyltransferase [Lyngbya sp. PCC 8106]